MGKLFNEVCCRYWCYCHVCLSCPPLLKKTNLDSEKKERRTNPDSEKKEPKTNPDSEKKEPKTNPDSVKKEPKTNPDSEKKEPKTNLDSEKKEPKTKPKDFKLFLICLLIIQRNDFATLNL